MRDSTLMFKELFNRFTKRADAKPFSNLTSDQEAVGAAPISRGLQQNIASVYQIFKHSDDIVIHELTVGANHRTPAIIIYLSSMVKNETMQTGLMPALIYPDNYPDSPINLDIIQRQIIPAGGVKKTRWWQEAAEAICRGSVALLIDGEDAALLIEMPVDNHRPVSEPITQSAAAGPSDAFNEDIRTNLALLRKRLPTPHLAVEIKSIGTVSKTKVDLVYLKDLVRPELIDEINSRLGRIDKDAILSSGQIEEQLQDSPYSLFSGIDASERPDKVASHLLEGGAAVFIDGTPFVLLMPCTLASQMSASDDYALRFWYASFIRLIRWSALFIAALAPAIYVALISYHQELIPPSLLVTVVANREGVPFPAFAEAFFMELSFETLREAGIRLPKTFGQTISIVGTIVVGQAAVSAGIVSSGMVVIVALTAIASYSIPSFSLSNKVRLLRFFFMILGGFLGLFGIMAGVSLLSLHLCSVRTFGIPYLSPMAPLSLSDLKDTFVRVPAWMMNDRPRLTGYQTQRQSPDMKPHPPSAHKPSGNRKDGPDAG